MRDIAGVEFRLGIDSIYVSPILTPQNRLFLWVFLST